MILPSKFRPAFEHGGYLSENHGGCLALWTPEEFEKQLRERQSEASNGGEFRNLARLWAQTSVEVDVDKQGRMLIPARLREFAQLTAEVLVNGAIDRVELWNPAVWDSKVKTKVEQQLLEGA